MNQSTLAQINNYDLDSFINGVLNSDPQYVVYFDEAAASSLDITKILQLVTQASNAYTRAAIAASVAKARKSAADQKYKLEFKIAKANADGKNAVDREASALAVTYQYAEEAELADTYYRIAVAAEESAKVASETARKLANSAVSGRKDDGAAESRSGSGSW